jgi:copper chaperone NosL
MLKNQMLKMYVIVGLLFMMVSCNPESKPIIYGEDKCEFCRMSIVDQKFGGEVVTQKGKTYKFDAVECLVNYIDEHVEDESKLKFILTNTYDHPGELVNASECMYLKSENMPSPMGMYLSGYNNQRSALIKHNEIGGEIYSWKELKESFTELPELSFSQ